MSISSKAKKAIAGGAAIACLLSVAACSSSSSDANSLYIFNGKSEIGAALEQLAQDYQDETGVQVKVFSAGSGQNVTEIMNTEMTSQDPPVIWATTDLLSWGPSGGDFIEDLSQTQNQELKQLLDEIPDSARITGPDDETFAIPITLEGYGYIVNTNMLRDLFNLDDAAQLVEDLRKCSYDDFRSFTDAVDDFIKGQSSTVTVNGHEYTTAAQKTDLTGSLTGVFVEAGAETWTYANHMINLPLNTVYSTFSDAVYGDADRIEDAKSAIVKEMEVVEYNTSHAAGEDGPNPRGSSFVDSTTGSYDYSLQLFADNKGLFYKQGSWIYPNLKKIGASNLETLDIIPIKMPFEQSDIKVEGRTPETFNTTIPVMPSYWMINKQAGEQQKKNAEDFIVWLYSSERGKQFLNDECGFIVYNDLDMRNENILNDAVRYYLDQGDTLSNPFDAAPGSWLVDVGDDMKQQYMVQAEWDPSTYAQFADKEIAHWKELKASLTGE
ncbi:extracellular solute-binding protein [Bifidobacterium phasiani]|uniref:Extracellular solute-binding protein n=1 Tax=Bifidobacterium phasiani TaxID=2834431 RepID=A0ABS6W8S4_9BIFI|nr:extracellular solute-binding protein [Bifidobacterium phasiani]MBW3082156.1 extracellular solute-binding protein [Bifidobacterium phasiani]